MELGYVGGMKELCWLNILLVCGNGLFVDDNISDQVIEMSRECLDVWYERRELISGTDGITMKAHLITHFHQIAKRFGNVCGYSYFYGEGLLYMLSWLISQKSENNLLNQVRIRLADYNMSSRVLTNKAIADYIMKSELATPIRSDSLDMTTTESDTLIMKSDNEYVYTENTISSSKMKNDKKNVKRCGGCFVGNKTKIIDDNIQCWNAKRLSTGCLWIVLEQCLDFDVEYSEIMETISEKTAISEIK
uniref:Uncharacterized protein n=1 Tax=Strongyloides stercoralis TaxID=6248 RepID=A0AAF5DQ49_STRER